MVEAAVLEEPVAKRGLPRVAERSVELLEHAVVVCCEPSHSTLFEYARLVSRARRRGEKAAPTLEFSTTRFPWSEPLYYQ